MDKFPQVLYKIGSEILFEGHRFDTLIVNGQPEFDDALSLGWLETPSAAVKADQDAKAAQEQAALDAAAAALNASKPADEAAHDGDKRAALEAEAKALGVEYGPRISDKKLEERIAEAKAAADKPADEAA